MDTLLKLKPVKCTTPATSKRVRSTTSLESKSNFGVPMSAYIAKAHGAIREQQRNHHLSRQRKGNTVAD